MSGVINLINFLIEKKEKGEEVDTLVFLDRSARNAAYIFYTTWEELSKFLGEENSVTLLPIKPKIRFINVGQGENDKHRDSKASGELGNIYNRYDFLGRVLIVDEMMASGTSVRMTGEAFIAAGYEPESLEGIANYATLPNWYYQDKIKGVMDVGSIYDRTRRLASKIDQLDQEVITHAIRRVGWLEFIYLCENSRSFKSFMSQINIRRRNDIRRAIQLVNQYLNWDSQIPTDELIRYLASAGGFLALAPDEEQKTAIRLFRTALKNMIIESINNGLVKLNDNFQINF